MEIGGSRNIHYSIFNRQLPIIMMPEESEVIGIIAGGGQFPLMLADSVRKQGHRVVAVALYEETDPELTNRVDQIVWIKLGQLGQLIEALRMRGVQKALLAEMFGRAGRTR